MYSKTAMPVEMSKEGDVFVRSKMGMCIGSQNLIGTPQNRAVRDA